MDVNAKLKEQFEKKNGITLDISKNFTTIFDCIFDIIEEYN